MKEFHRQGKINALYLDVRNTGRIQKSAGGQVKYPTNDVMPRIHDVPPLGTSKQLLCMRAQGAQVPTTTRDQRMIHFDETTLNTHIINISQNYIFASKCHHFKEYM